jgi:hypothetical protein
MVVMPAASAMAERRRGSGSDRSCRRRWRSSVGRAHRLVYRSTAASSDQVEGMRQQLEQALEVLLCSLGAARQCDDERAGSFCSISEVYSNDRSRESGERRDGERMGEHEGNEPRRWLVDERGHCLKRESGQIRYSISSLLPLTSGVQSRAPNPVPPLVNTKSTPSLHHCSTIRRISICSSGAMEDWTTL